MACNSPHMTCAAMQSHNQAYARLCVLGDTPAADCPDRLFWTARFIRGETLGDAGHSRPITIRNSGNLNARVHGLAITGPQAAEFQVIDPGATGSGGRSIGYGRFGRALTPGQSFGAAVRFRPPTTPSGTRQAMLKVR